MYIARVAQPRIRLYDKGFVSGTFNPSGLDARAADAVHRPSTPDCPVARGAQPVLAGDWLLGLVMPWQFNPMYGLLVGDRLWLPLLLGYHCRRHRIA